MFSALCQTDIWAWCFWTGCDDCFDQLLCSSSNRCGRVLFRPANTEKRFHALHPHFCQLNAQKACEAIVWRLHTQFWTIREARHSCKEWGYGHRQVVVWTWTGNETSCAGKCMPFLKSQFSFFLPVKLVRYTKTDDWYYPRLFLKTGTTTTV